MKIIQNISTSISPNIVAEKTTSPKVMSFDMSLQKSILKSTDLSFGEYKDLTYSDINKLFPLDEAPKENESAKTLKKITTATTDDVLNKILFEKASDMPDDEPTKEFFNRVLLAPSLEVSLREMTTHEFNRNLTTSFRVAIDKLPKDEQQKILASIGLNSLDEIQEVSIGFSNEDLDGKLMPNELFRSYENTKNNFYQNYNSFSDATKKYLPNEIKLYEDIKTEYQNRLLQKQSLLDELTQYRKPNPFETYA